MIKLSKQEIEHYVKSLRDTPNSQDNSSFAKKVSDYNRLKTLIFILKSMVDFMVLKIRLYLPKYRNKKIIYTSSRFTTITNGVVEDRIVKPLFTDNLLFINASKEIWMNQINHQKVYNIGGFVKFLAFFKNESSQLMKNFYAYQKVNKWLLSTFQFKEVYFLVHYDLNNLAIIFSDYRHKLKLIEIQHGGIINYFPYKNQAPIKMIDVFYVKNQSTINYLKNHLSKGYVCDYKLIPYPISTKKIVQGNHILYASTVEFNGLHPVFLNFLKTHDIKNLHVYVRLHPREKDKKDFFKKQIEHLNVKIVFDESNNWLEAYPIKNLVVVSPWSSVIEDAADNGFKTLILEPFGKERFDYLIDEHQVFFTPTLELFKEKLKILLNL